MKVKTSYDNVGDVPELFKSAYTEQDGKYVLTGEIEVKTQEDIDAMKQAKDNANAELSQLKTEFATEKLSKTELQSKYDAVELQLKEGADPEKIQAHISEKIGLATKELTEQLEQAKAENGELTGKVFATEKSNLVKSNLDKFGEQSRGDAEFFFDSILERSDVDGSWITNGRGGIDKGLTVDKALEKVTEMKPHWLPQNTAGSATSSMGTGGQNNLSKYNELKTKVESGKATRQETNEYIQVAETVANEAKQGE